MKEKVWITRSEPGASRLGNLLESHTFQPLVRPVIKVGPTNLPQPKEKIDLWVFVSVHAVCFAVNAGWNSNSTCIAVGPATKMELMRYTSNIRIPQRFSSEGMLELILAEFPSNLSIAIVSAEGGRADLCRWLIDAGHRVSVWNAYERTICVEEFDASVADIVVASSGVALAPIKRVLSRYLGSNFASVRLVVSSARVKKIAEELGFTHIATAKGPTDKAVLNALLAISGSSKQV